MCKWDSIERSENHDILELTHSTSTTMEIPVYALKGSFGAKTTMRFIIYVHCVWVNGLNFVCKLLLLCLININDEIWARFLWEHFDKCDPPCRRHSLPLEASHCGASTFQSNNRSCCACLIHRKSHPSHSSHVCHLTNGIFIHIDVSATKSLWNYLLVCEP